MNQVSLSLHDCIKSKWVNTAPTSVVPMRAQSIQRQIEIHLPELILLEDIIKRSSSCFTARLEAEIPLNDNTHLPLYSLHFGNAAPENPAVIITGGVHGVERIGSQVILGFLQSFIERISWDESVHHLLENISLTIIPIVNPSGMYLRKRCNRNGVDLNRNAPLDVVDTDGFRAHWLAGGQRWSRHWPWFRGKNAQLEAENQVLERILVTESTKRPLVMSLDVHSGFGFEDRLWFPYAYRRKPFDQLAEVMALKLLWQRTCPHYNYRFEPQSSHYLTHGDIWDYLHKRVKDKQLFLPLTLELGSWNWVRKRPSQLFSRLGLFHPMVPHRLRRAVRDHQMLLQFILHAAASSSAWLPNEHNRDSLWQSAINLWYQELL